jgi:hypothetical protein
LSKYKRIEIKRVKTIPFDNRDTKVDISNFSKAHIPGDTFGKFLLSLPNFLKVNDLRELVQHMVKAKDNNNAIIWMMGAHPLKVGLAPIITDLVELGFVSHLALNGAGAIHDLELAFFGRTSEDVAANLTDGKFGMIEETPLKLFQAVDTAFQNHLGLGEGIGTYILDSKPEYLRFSVIASCIKNNIPVTIHVAIGTDTICQHPGFDGAKFGKLSQEDFLILSESIASLTGGAIINFGSAVILPEVFLKALTVARNIYGKVDNFAAANFDMIQHYRPNLNVVTRPVQDSGKGFSFTGHHEIMMPLLAAAIKTFYQGVHERK